MKKELGVVFIIICSFLFIGKVEAKTYELNTNQLICSNKTCDENQLLNVSGIWYNLEGETTTESAISSSKNPCLKLKAPLKFIGYVVLILKIIIPLLLIIFGMIDLLKAVTAGKDGELPKSLKSFAFRVGAAVLIFFIPSIISFIFGLLDAWTEVEADYNICQTCILNVNKCDETSEKTTQDSNTQSDEKESPFIYV